MLGIDRAFDAAGPAIVHVRADHRRFHLAVPALPLPGADVVTALQQMRGKAVVAGMLADPRRADRARVWRPERGIATPALEYFRASAWGK